MAIRIPPGSVQTKEYTLTHQVRRFFMYYERIVESLLMSPFQERVYAISVTYQLGNE
ncbi:hypothetical protein QNI22_31680 [Cytophagaceae bacterium BD1B2-1]|uniref:Uncharacterized protein n=1 Tax=Xanthocytophaga agilis TaxID=3048010 RepID=A0AAE3R7N9_9BACT|nr:hypothetical protein [Xanthocytophaga agilis]